jgi:hypothetical protein
MDVIDGKTQAALNQIGHEEKAAAADEVSPIVRHRASIARQKVMGFAEAVIGPDPLPQPILRASVRAGTAAISGFVKSANRRPLAPGGVFKDRDNLNRPTSHHT